MKETALYYHQELLELEKLISDIEDALEWVEGGTNRISTENDPECFFAPAFSFAEISLRNSLKKFKLQHSDIVSKMSNVYL